MNPLKLTRQIRHQVLKFFHVSTGLWMFRLYILVMASLMFFGIVLPMILKSLHT